jgi:hypothetical protein
MGEEEHISAAIRRCYQDLCERSPRHDARYILMESASCIETALRRLFRQLSARDLFGMLSRLQDIGEIGGELADHLHTVRKLANDVKHQGYIPAEEEARGAVAIVSSFVAWVAEVERSGRHVPSAEIRNVIIEQRVSHGNQSGVVVHADFTIRNAWDRTLHLIASFHGYDYDGENYEEKLVGAFSWELVPQAKHMWKTDFQGFVPYGRWCSLAETNEFNVVVQIEDDEDRIIASRSVEFLLE